ncbi:MAG: gamma-glutamyltransferase family protein [Phycisphaerales bacterium]|nr:gamma-glutamyltransferase family protein [Phycisphaerales bacterium]
MSTLPLIAFFTVALFASACFAMTDRPVGAPFATRSEVLGVHGMAATSQPLATQVAIDILKAGGSAVDAAVAANATLGLMEPTGSGVGGDLFAIVWDPATKRLHGLNASGPAPRLMTRDSFANRGLSRIPDFGPLSISVPGCVDGWRLLSERFGRLPLNAVLAPAARYAREGFPVSEVIAHHWAAGAKLREYPGFADTFLINDKAPAKGDIFRNPALAATLESIGRDGPRAFYDGEIAQRIGAFCEAHDCPLRAADLAAYHAEWVEPVSVSFHRYDVWELPPNGQGLAVLQILNLLEPIDVKAMGHNSAAYLHHLVEAKKIAFEDRARWYADPAFAEAPIAALMSKSYAAERRKLLNPAKASKRIPAGDVETLQRIASAEARLREGDTIYLTVADETGMMVSLIQSNYRGFGSGLCPTGLGFCLQDRASLFSLDPAHPNTLEPGKRPFHTIIPGFVTRGGDPVLSFGVMGGDMQPQGHVQVLLNMLVFGMNPQEAGDAPRLYHTGSSEPTGETMTDGGRLALESGIGADVRQQLASMGHTLVDDGYFGGYQAIMRDPRGFWIGASESRKDGCAIGY